jgi:hypothetical protein
VVSDIAHGPKDYNASRNCSYEIAQQALESQKDTEDVAALLAVNETTTKKLTG